jgi:hypothetical protein
LENFTKQCEDFAVEQEQTKQILARYDEILAGKSEKFQVTDLEVECKRKYYDIETAEATLKEQK